MTGKLLLIPPVAFCVYFLLVRLISRTTASIEQKPAVTCKDKHTPYACGENFEAQKNRPDYTDFFPFAIFFTIMHVAGLMLATLAITPGGPVSYAGGILYLMITGTILAILLMR